MTPSVGPGPLAGVRVLDLTSVLMGPFATLILAQLGAEVIKLESPEGDVVRQIGPMKPGHEHDGLGPLFVQTNMGKKSIALDLKAPEGRAAAVRLAQEVDVLVSNLRPQALLRLGLDEASLRPLAPRLIHVSCVGFDPEGPYADKPAYDDLIQGATGIPWLMQRHGSPEPTYAPITLADRVTGLHTVYAVTAALYAREKCGVGQAVVVPMFEALTQFVLGDHLAGLAYEPPVGEPGYARLLTPHRKPYATADGHLCVLIYNDKQWQAFFAATGRDDLAHDPRFVTQGGRAANIDAVYAEVARCMKTRGTAEWRQLLDAADIPNQPMNSPADLLDDPHHAATGFIRQVQHPVLGGLRTPATPTRWSATPPARDLAPAPTLGEHTAEVLASLGARHPTVVQEPHRHEP